MYSARVWINCLALLSVYAFTACQEQASAPTALDFGQGLRAAQALAAKEDETTVGLIDRINQALAAQGAAYRLGVIEYLTTADGQQVGRTVFARDLGKQLGHHFVPADPRRGGLADIAWLNDLSEGAATGGLSAAQTDAAINRAMATWENVRCSTIPLTDLGSFIFDFGVVQSLAGFGGILAVFADITFAGWLPGAFFDVIFPPDGSTFVVGVTFTFIFIDPDQLPDVVPTDIDGNGKLDTAFREIYYNNAFPYGIDTGFPIDVESVALHEAGHGLSQSHFGTIFGTDANGKLHFAPRALMNAAYSGIQQEIRGTDNGGHCSIWARWPNS